MLTVELIRKTKDGTIRKIFPAEAISTSGNQITMTTNRHKNNENHITYTISEALWDCAVIYNGGEMVKKYTMENI